MKEVETNNVLQIKDERIKQLGEEITVLQSQAQTAEIKDERITQLRDEITVLQSQAQTEDMTDELQDKIQLLESQNTEFEQQCLETMSDLDDLTKKLFLKEKEVDKLRIDLTDSQTKISGMEDTMLDYQQQLVLKESEVALKQHSVSELKDQVGTKEEELANLRKSRLAKESQKDLEIKELTDQVNSIKIAPQQDVDVEVLHSKIQRLGLVLSS